MAQEKLHIRRDGTRACGAACATKWRDFDTFSCSVIKRKGFVHAGLRRANKGKDPVSCWVVSCGSRRRTDCNWLSDIFVEKQLVEEGRTGTNAQIWHDMGCLEDYACMHCRVGVRPKHTG
eukprot:359919-Chlamydomonas_euryale.AAC.7